MRHNSPHGQGELILLYAAYDIVRRATRPMYQLLDAGQKLARDEDNPLRNTVSMRTLAGIWEFQARALKAYDKPRYLVWEHLGDLEIELEEQVIQSLPFADLLRFPMPGSDRASSFECTATVGRPSSPAARAIRMAISPRLAIRSLRKVIGSGEGVLEVFGKGRRDSAAAPS